MASQYSSPYTSTTPSSSSSSSSKSSSFYSSLSPIFSPITNVLERFQSWREKLDLPNPGTVENLGRELKATHLTNYTFDGFRCDINKTISMNPAFQVTHGIAMGAQGGPMSTGVNPGSYNFGAMYGSKDLLLHGSVDLEGAVTGRANYAWSGTNVTKAVIQLAGNPAAQSMVQLEHERLGKDYSFNLKTLNPNPALGTGMLVASYLQSLTQNFALGAEVLYQIPQPGLEDAAMSYLAKWTGAKKDWIATANISGHGLIQTNYWQKLGPKVEAGVDLLLIPDIRPRERKALAVLGAKWDFTMSTLRGQVDSQGKVSAMLEQRLNPVLSFLLTGEIDHAKSTSKFGVGLMMEMSSMTEEEMMAAQTQAIQPPA